MPKGAIGVAVKFIDLFAGLGGFHLALKSLGHECVFASEVDRELVSLYDANFQMMPFGDIRMIETGDIPEHDILCAGFPCQPFSKAGEQQGLACTKWGDLFSEIIRIIHHHNPEYILLENVSNLENHDRGKTWKGMHADLTRLGYDVKYAHLSPHEFGIPQVRKRMFIVARRGSLRDFAFPEKLNTETSIHTILEEVPSQAKQLPIRFIACLEVWQEFLQRFPSNEEFPSYPIWAMEFGADYPYLDLTPYSISDEELGAYRGVFGIPLSDISPKERRSFLPHHATTSQETFPSWKINFIKKNRELYQRHQKWIDIWKAKLFQFPHSLQKLEWNCKGATLDIWDKIVRFRASGVRVKLPNTAPSLNTIDTQIPIIAWERRYMTMSECARLHGMWDIQIPELVTPAIRALGNAVNVEIVKRIAQALLRPEPIVEDRSVSLEHAHSINQA